MKENGSQSSIARRQFLTRLGAGVGVVAATAISPPPAAAIVHTDVPWRPARHEQDDWFDKIPGEHRFVLDTTTADGLDLAVQFAGNYFIQNQNAYGLKNSDLAVVIVMRHRSTPFAYTDKIWAKYGKQLSELAEFTDPKTGEPLLSRLDVLFDHVFARKNFRNVFLPPGDARGSANGMAALIDKGVHFAVCETSSQSVSRNIARVTNATPDAVLKELAANLIPNARMVPAGIVAVNRAQERGYSYVFTA